VATVLTLLTALTLTCPREWSDGRGRDTGVIRTSRSGPQRLDSIDVSTFGYEDADVVVAPQTEVVSVPVALGATPDATPAASSRPGLHVPDLGFVPVIDSDRSFTHSPPHRPAFGRAPPLA
jgi:hypothetical protein